MTSILPSKEQRKLLELATVKYMQAVGDALPYLEARGISAEDADTAALGVVTGEIEDHAHLRGRLAIPYMTDTGVVAMNFRCLQAHNCKATPGHEKYMIPVGQKDYLYGVRTYHDARDTVCVTEGELDALILHNMGIPALGISGSGKWEQHWGKILDDFARVVILSDGDESGRKLVNSIKRAIPWATNVRMPNGEDVGSMYVKEGPGYLRTRIGL